MRERLTLAFVAVTLLLLLGAAFLWTNEVSDRLVADETTAAESEARAIAFIVAERAATEPLTDDDVRRLVSDDERVELDVDGTRLDVAGADFDPDSDEHVTATVVTDERPGHRHPRPLRRARLAARPWAGPSSWPPCS